MNTSLNTSLNTSMMKKKKYLQAETIKPLDSSRSILQDSVLQKSSQKSRQKLRLRSKSLMKKQVKPIKPVKNKVIKQQQKDGLILCVSFDQGNHTQYYGYGESQIQKIKCFQFRGSIKKLPKYYHIFEVIYKDKKLKKVQTQIALIKSKQQLIDPMQVKTTHQVELKHQKQAFVVEMSLIATVKLEKGTKIKSLQCKVVKTKQNQRCNYVARFWKNGFPLEIGCNLRIGSVIYKIADMRMSEHQTVIAKIRQLSGKDKPNQMAKIQFLKQDFNRMCSVCKKNFNKEADGVIFCCDIAIHLNCIQEWLKQNIQNYNKTKKKQRQVIPFDLKCETCNKIVKNKYLIDQKIVCQFKEQTPNRKIPYIQFQNLNSQSQNAQLPKKHFIEDFRKIIIGRGGAVEGKWKIRNVSVSKEHCFIEKTQNKNVVVKDLQSKYGTVVSMGRSCKQFSFQLTSQQRRGFQISKYLCVLQII